MRTLREMTEMIIVTPNEARALFEGDDSKPEMIPLQRNLHIEREASTVTLDNFVENVQPVRPEWDAKEERFFIWIESWCGLEPIAQICTKTFLPKVGIIAKVKLEPPRDTFSLVSLMALYPHGREKKVVEVKTVKPEPALLVKKIADVYQEKAAAKAKGYEGDACTLCGCFSMLRTGTCLRCDNCGTTTGCS